MRYLRGAIVVLFMAASFLFIGHGTAVASFPHGSDLTHHYVYNAPHQDGPVVDASPEPGPPFASPPSHVPSDALADQPGSWGAAMRPDAAWSLAHADSQASVGQGPADVVNGEASSLRRSGVAANFGPKSLGAAQRLRYEGASYHGATRQGAKNAAPTNGQEVLDFSMQVKATSPRRIGADPDTGEFVIFDQTVEGVFHGHARTWDELTGGMQSLLRKSGVVDRRGNIQ